MVAEVLPLTMVGIILIVALAISTLARKIKQNEVIGFILAGFLLGPFFLGFLHPEEALTKGLSELGLFFMLFYLGIELSWKEFLDAGSTGFGLAVIDVILTSGGCIAILLLLGHSLFFSIAVGMMLFCTSTAIVAKFIIDRKMMDNPASKLAIAINILQDFMGILLLVFISSMASISKGGIVVMLGTGVTALVFVVSAFFAVNHLSKIVEKWMKKNDFGPNKMTLYAIGIGLVAASLAGFLGLNASLGAYFAGFALSETSSGKKIKKNLVFMIDFFLVFFFVTFGTTIFYDYGLQKVVLPLWGDFLAILALALVLSGLKVCTHSLTTRIFGPLFGLNGEDSSSLAILLIPLGEFLIIISAFVVPILPNVLEQKMINFLAFLLILITLILFQPAYGLRSLHQKIMSFIPKLPEPKKNTMIKAHTPYTIKQAKDMAFSLFIVLCLAWVTLLFYEALPNFGFPVPYSRPVTAFLVFAFFAFYPFIRALKAFKRIFRQTVYGGL